jgi:hypothetical protein
MIKKNQKITNLNGLNFRKSALFWRGPDYRNRVGPNATYKVGPNSDNHIGPSVRANGSDPKNRKGPIVLTRKK